MGRYNDYRDQAEAALVLGYLTGVSFNRYVDSVNGSDSNDGLTPATAKATFGAITQAPDMRIGIAKDSVFRAAISITQTGVVVGTYGTGNRPAFVGSTEITDTWSNVSGNVWSISLASSPTNLYLVAGYSYDQITKLVKNTSTPTTPGTNEWGHSSGTLYVNSAVDPNTLHYERVTASTTDGITLSAADVSVSGVASLMNTRDGIKFLADRGTIIDCDASANANDGINGVVAKDCLVDSCYSWNNGTTAAKSISGSDGDGISFHGDGSTGYSSVTIQYCDIRYNRKSGIGNQSACIATTFGNTISGCFMGIIAFNTVYTGEVPMVQHHAYNVVIRSASDSYAIYGASSPLTHPLEVIIENCSLYSSVATAGSGGIMVNYSAISGAEITMSIKNTIISGFARGIDSRDTAATLTVENDCVSGNTSNYFDNGTRSPSLASIAVDSTTSNPLWVDAANGDFNLQPGSPCIDTGQDLGYTRDMVGNPVVPPPDMGALEHT